MHGPSCSSPHRPCTAVGQLDAISQSRGWWRRKVAVDGPAQPMRTAALRSAAEGRTCLEMLESFPEPWGHILRGRLAAFKREYPEH